MEDEKKNKVTCGIIATIIAAVIIVVAILVGGRGCAAEQPGSTGDFGSFTQSQQQPSSGEA